RYQQSGGSRKPWPWRSVRHLIQMRGVYRGSFIGRGDGGGQMAPLSRHDAVLIGNDLSGEHVEQQGGGCVLTPEEYVVKPFPVAEIENAHPRPSRRGRDVSPGGKRESASEPRHRADVEVFSVRV